MNVFTSLKLGQSTSLLCGYKAKAIIGSHNEVPFIPSLKNALSEQDIIISKPSCGAKWSYPTITLCNNVESLLSSMLLIRLRPSSCKGSPPAKWPAGALLLAGLTPEERSSALSEISHEICLDLNTLNRSYALVCRSREVGTTTHHCYERGMFGDPKPDCTLKPETLMALKRLEKLSKQEPDVTLEGARGYMAFFETFGSHFVSSVTVGDVLLQVFAYEPAEYKKLVEAYRDRPNDLSGPTAQSFMYFTVPHSKSTGYGYTAAIGKICIASDDPALTETLRCGLWDENTYACTSSIFAPYNRSDSVDVNTAFKKTVITSIELSSLEVFAEYIRKQIFHCIFKAAMYCRYHNGTGVEPHFINTCPYDIDSIFKKSDPISGDGLLSTIATPSINVFKEHFELNSLQIEDANIVKTFSIFTNALTITSEAKVIDVPGSNSVTLIGHVISVRVPSQSAARPLTLCLSENAYLKIKAEIVCNKFYGGLLITTGQCSKALVVANGLVFEIINGGIALTADVQLSSVSSNDTVQKHITSMQFSLIAAEARLNYLLAIERDPNQDVDAALSLIRSFLLWLGSSSADEHSHDIQLLNVQARAVYLAKFAGTNQRIGTPVPYLKYIAYKDVVDSVQNALRTITGDIQNFQEQIRARKAEEREIDRENSLKENIIKSGNLLEKYISAQARYQESIANQLSSVAYEKEKKLEGAKRTMEKLSDALREQRQIVRNAIEDYKEAVTDWETRQIVKAALNIASNIFALEFTFLTPSSSFSALKDLGETVQRIQKAIKVFDAVIKTYEAFKSFPKSPDKVINALSGIGPKGLELPSSLEWDEMKVNMEAVLANGPQVSARSTLSAAFGILVLRGKALIECQNTIQSIASELSSTEQQILLSQQQKKHLSELKVTLSAGPENLDVETIDLVGLTGQLVFFERQMLLTLSSIIVTQDAALQYEYLQPPVTINSFSLLDLQLTIVNQALTINRGLSVQPPPKVQQQPIVYEIHGVKPKDITNGNSLTFSIGLSKREFASYNYVRVLGVDAEVGGIVFTDSGKYYTELTFEGQPFYDRDFNCEPRTFSTNPRLFTFLHDISSSSHFKTVDPCPPPTHTNAVSQFTISTGDDPFGDKISNITPFSTWKFSLPPSASNKGINFDDHSRGLTVRVTFHIFAQLKESTEDIESRILSSTFLRSRIGHSICTFPHATKKGVDLIDTPLFGLASSGQHVSTNLVQLSSYSQDVSSKQVLDMMRNKSVCAGWDVVFSMTAKEVNAQLALQYKDRVGQPEFVRETGKQVKENTTSEGVVLKTTFSFQFKAPKLQFLLNNSNSAQVMFPIKSGTSEFAIKLNGNWTIISKGSVKESDDAYVQGDVPLSVFRGSVSTQHDVVVRLNKGSFTAYNFEAAVSNPNMRIALTDYFTNLKNGYELYRLGTLDLKKVTVLSELTPTAFKFNICHTPSDRDLLQLFIATTGQLQSTTSLYLQEPIPSLYESSLIISSELFFKAVLPASLGDGGGLGLSMSANEPQGNSNKDKVWKATATAGSISAPYRPEHARDYSASPGIPGKSNILIINYIDWVGVPSDRVTLYLAGMKFKCGESDVVEMTFNVDKKFTFKYGSQFRYSTGGSWSEIRYSNFDLQVKVSTRAALPITVSGSGQNQNISIMPTQSGVNIEGELERSAVCQCNDRDLQKSFLEKLQKNMKPKLTEMFTIEFAPVSIFALKNILFPAKNLIEMKEAALPGDLVVFGNFTDSDD